ncbi:hypothetical protein RND81_04G219300 [Saponaria officinalis]|uniref:Uncharacterized protein n=1 Tax=Saponaria officinalis TaxID=3572 RepID=A0AAW1LGH9_SAPOF
MGRLLLDRKSSIETEPRTLNFRQIDIAREAALYVIHTRSPEEAYQIFTKGMESIDTVRAKTISMATKMSEYSDGEDEDDDDYYLPLDRAMKQGTTYKDVVTAPF